MESNTVNGYAFCIRTQSAFPHDLYCRLLLSSHDVKELGQLQNLAMAIRKRIIPILMMAKDGKFILIAELLR